jgi:MFS family permease
MSLLSEGAERQGIAQGLAFGVMNLAWAAGAMGGPSLGGTIAGATSDATAYGLCAALCLGTLGVLRASPR